MSNVQFDQRVVRNLTSPALPLLNPTSPVFYKKSPEGLSAIPSSIAPASPKEESSLSSSRPLLEPPKTQHVMIPIIALQKALEAVQDLHTIVLGKLKDIDAQELDRLEQSYQKVLREHAEEIKAEQSWSVLSMLGRYILSSGFLALGIACLTNGLIWPGIALTGGGALGIGSSIAHDTGAIQTVAGWISKNEETKVQVAHQLEMGIFFLQLGLGFAGGLSAYGGGLAFTPAQQITQTLSTAGTTMTVGARLGSAYHQKAALDAQAKLEEIKAQITEKRYDFSGYLAEPKKMLNLLSSLTSALREMITSLKQEQVI